MKKIKVGNVVLDFRDPRPSGNHFMSATSVYNGLTDSGKKVINVYGPYEPLATIHMVNSDVIHECHVVEHNRKESGTFDMRTSRELFKQFDKDGITISKNIDLATAKSMYITPQCILPRYKLKDLKEKHNIKVTRSVDKASHVILNETRLLNTFFEGYIYSCYDLYTGDELIEELTKFKNKLNELDPLTFKQNISLHYWSNYKDLKLINYTQYLDDAIKYIEDIKGHFDYFKLYADTKRILYMFIENNKEYDEDFFVLSEKGQELYSSILINKPTLLSQDVITSALGETTIGKTEYDFIKTLFKTKDRDNILLGMTMLANSNFKTSAGYAGILIADYFHVIACNKYFHSVAFKNLFSFLKFNKYNLESNHRKLSRYDSLAQVLIEKNLLTDEIKELLEKKVMKIYLSLAHSNYFQPLEFKCVTSKSEEIEEEPSYVDELLNV